MMKHVWIIVVKLDSINSQHVQKQNLVEFSDLQAARRAFPYCLGRRSRRSPCHNGSHEVSKCKNLSIYLPTYLSFYLYVYKIPNSHWMFLKLLRLLLRWNNMEHPMRKWRPSMQKATIAQVIVAILKGQSPESLVDPDQIKKIYGIAMDQYGSLDWSKFYRKPWVFPMK